MKMKQFEPHSIDVGFFQLIEEYVLLGNLASKKKFGFYPSDFQRNLKNGFVPVGDIDEFLALEKECTVRFRSGRVQLGVKNLFFRGQYVNTSFSIMPKKVELKALLEILRETGGFDNGGPSFLYLEDINEGALAYDNCLIFKFGRIHDKYYLSTIETSYAENEKTKRNLYFASVARTMEKITTRNKLNELIGGNPDVEAAVARVNKVFPVVSAG